MNDIKDIHLVVAAPGTGGEATFVDPPSPCRLSIPGAIDAAFLWGTDRVQDLSEGIGKVPADLSFPPPGGTRFGIMSFPARSAGKLNVSHSVKSGDAEVRDDNPGMHRSNSIDYEVIISGKVDIVLPNGERRTLGPGSCLVMGGVMHAWENHYDEPCVYAAVIIGAQAKRR